MATLKQKLLGGVTFLTLFDVSGAAAAPPATPSWTGFYIGGHSGYSWGNVSGDTAHGVIPPVPPFSLVPGTSVFSIGRDVDPNGALGGIQAGYNFQAGQAVFGIEADFSWTGQRDTFNFNGHTIAFGEDFSYQETFAAKLKYLGTVRGRLGYAYGDFLPYITGGVAWGRLSIDMNWREAQSIGINIPPFATATFAGSEAHTLVGWTLGAGFEYAFAKQWSTKAEYLYVDLGDKTYFAGIQGGGSFGLQDHIVRIGINFRP